VDGDLVATGFLTGDRQRVEAGVTMTELLRPRLQLRWIEGGGVAAHLEEYGVEPSPGGVGNDGPYILGAGVIPPGYPQRLAHLDRFLPGTTGERGSEEKQKQG